MPTPPRMMRHAKQYMDQYSRVNIVTEDGEEYHAYDTNCNFKMQEGVVVLNFPSKNEVIDGEFIGRVYVDHSDHH